MDYCYTAENSAKNPAAGSLDIVYGGSKKPSTWSARRAAFSLVGVGDGRQPSVQALGHIFCQIGQDVILQCGARVFVT